MSKGRVGRCLRCHGVRSLVGRNLCRTCYQHARRHGDLTRYARRKQSHAQGAALLAESLQNGLTMYQISQYTHTPLPTLYGRAGAWLGGVKRVRSGVIAVRSLGAVAVFLGVSQGLVHDWIEDGLLVAKRSGDRRQFLRKSSGRTFLIADCDLQDALLQREPWPCLRLDAMTDPDWREMIAHAQSQANGRWWSVSEIAGSLHCTPSWVRRQMPNWAGQRIKVRRNWYVWGAADTPPAPQKEAEDVVCR